MKKVSNAADLKNLVEQEGILNNEKVIDEYYHKSDNSIGVLYKAKLEFLKDNFKEAIDIITKDYIPTSGESNYTHYFLTLCYLEIEYYKSAYTHFSKINSEEKMSISKEEYNGLKTYLEKKNNKKYSLKESSYLVDQIKEYSKDRALDKNSYKDTHTRFIVEKSDIKRIIDKIEKNIDNATPIKSLDMYDKYYFYYKNIGIENNFLANVFMVKTLRNSNKVLYIEPCVPKKTSVINDYSNLKKGRYNEFVGDDLENEIETNGLTHNSSYINWLFNKYPYIKSIALYKVKLECALGNNAEAVKIIKEDYLPVFGADNKIFFILLDLYCNVGKNFEAYRLLTSNSIDGVMDDLFIQKYRAYAFMLEGTLGIIDTEMEPHTYLESQLCNYDSKKAVNHIKEYNEGKDSSFELLIDSIYDGDLELYVSDLKDDILPEQTQSSYVKERKLNAKKTYKNDVLDNYYFYKPFVGRNKNSGEYTDYLCIQTKKNTDEIISMFPVTPKPWYVINDALEDEKKNTFR